MVCIDSFRMQTMAALIKNFCGGPGGGFFKKSPLVAEGRRGKYGTDRVVRLSV
jgi:hypothetical protein